jgi:protein involved in polysaccharide export with SLBB domain
MLVFTVLTPVIAQDAPSGKASFGLQADIFKRAQEPLSSQDYSRNLSVLSIYAITPGDLFELTVGMPSKEEIKLSTFPIQLQDDYSLEMPFIGRVNVRGMSPAQMQNLVTGRIKAAMPVQYVSFLLKTPATFNVFIYGGVVQPGHITVNSLIRVIDAVAMAGGFKTGGSYRTIQLTRDGNAATVDIARFYTEGREDANPFLKPGDSIFVPFAHTTVTLAGQVKFPGVYELITGETLADVLNFAGGMTPEARTDGVEIARLGGDGKKSVRTAAPTKAGQEILKDGDTVTVRSIFENTDFITIEGAVFGAPTSGKAPLSAPIKPVRVELPYYPGMTVLSALDSVGGLTPYVLPEKTTLTRRSDGSVSLLDAATLWKTRAPGLDTELFPGDFLLIPMSKQMVFVTGEVYLPGPIPYVNGYIVNDYILQAGGVIDNIGNPDGVYVVADDGKRTRVSKTAEAAPGLNIHVEKKVLFQTDQFFKNMLIITGFMTAILFTLDTSLNFWDRLKGYY